MDKLSARAIVQTGYGGTEVLRPQTIRISPPGPGEVRIRHRAIGVNFHDIYVRTGLYRTMQVPGVPGIEATGEIVELGSGVEGWDVGQRVAYVDRTYGAYCDQRNMSTDLLMIPPDRCSDGVVASSFLRGLTAAMLMERVYRVKSGDRCLVHAVAGSTGTLLVKWARHSGAEVVGTYGRRRPAADVAELCERVYSYESEGWDESIGEDLGGVAHYVCDSVGAPTIGSSFAAARPCGHIALFGQAGGKVERICVDELAKKSLTVTRPLLFDYLAEETHRDAIQRAWSVMLEDQIIEPCPPMEIPLEQAAKAHSLLENRLSDRALVLVP